MSDRHKSESGKGKHKPLDIYRTKWLDNSWTKKD